MMNQMQNVLEQLQSFGIKFEKEVIDSHTDITEELMVREKKLYLDRRYYQSIDVD